MSSNLDLMAILQSPHCCTTTGRHGILVKDWMLDLCTQVLLDHVRLSTGVGPPNSSLLVESESESENDILYILTEKIHSKSAPLRGPHFLVPFRRASIYAENGSSPKRACCGSSCGSCHNQSWKNLSPSNVVNVLFVLKCLDLQNTIVYVPAVARPAMSM